MSRKSPVFTYYDHIMQITDLREQLAARDAELAEARAEIERLRGVISVIYARAKSQPTHICEVADFDLSIIADECSAALAPAPPEREERPERPVMLLDANFGRSSAEEHTDGPLTQNP